MKIHWEDQSADSPGAAWQGLMVHVSEAPGRPHWHRRACRGRIALFCGDQAVHLARIHPYHHGFWRLSCSGLSSWNIVPPLPAQVGSQHAPFTDAWWRHWCLYFAQELATSPASPLYVANWVLEPLSALGHAAPAPPRAAPGSRLSVVYEIERCLDAPDLAWESWWLNGSGALLRTRRPSFEASGRLKMWRKRARDATLPPLLVEYDSGLDAYLLLDGHDRLRAALLEGAAVPVVGLFPLHEMPRRPAPGPQAAIMAEAARRITPDRRGRSLSTEQANALLIQAFDDRPSFWSRSRAWALDGAVWQKLASATAAGLASDHGLWTGEPPAKGEQT